jgi:hypothetical protein
VLGATLLPFWPPLLVAAIALAAGLACWVDPRAGLALALAAAVFPLGNAAAGAAVVYAVFALGWLVLTWRDARHGLLFVCGPLLAALGLLPLAPLVVQRAHGTVRRAAQGALVVLSASLLATTSAGHTSLGISPLSTPEDTAHAASSAVLDNTFLTISILGMAAAAALLPWVRRRTPYGVGAIGFVLTAASVLCGAGVASTLVVVLVWAGAGASSALGRRS